MRGPDPPNTVDVVVIGMGVAGEAVAAALGSSRLDVIGVDSGLVGGECPYWGCIPTKMMIRASALIAETRRVPGSAGSRQIRRRTTQDLVLLLQRADPLLRLPQLGVLGRGGVGLDASSTSAWRSQLRRQDSAMPKSEAICLIVCPGSRLRATFTTSSRNSLGNGLGTVHILPAMPHNATDQMSPIRAAVPVVVLAV
jgi:glycine/D-amino acid oxidase-like deaminating enzyme